MVSATLENSYNRQRLEAELFLQVQLASEEFRSASEELKAGARRRYAEILAVFTELLLGNVHSRTFAPIVRVSVNQQAK